MLRGNPRALTRAIGLINRSLLVRYSDADLVVVHCSPPNCGTGVLAPGRCLLVHWPYAGVAQHRKIPEGVAVTFRRSEWMECSRQA